MAFSNTSSSSPTDQPMIPPISNSPRRTEHYSATNGEHDSYMEDYVLVDSFAFSPLCSSPTSSDDSSAFLISTSPMIEDHSATIQENNPCLEENSDHCDSLLPVLDSFRPFDSSSSSSSPDTDEEMVPLISTEENNAPSFEDNFVSTNRERDPSLNFSPSYFAAADAATEENKPPSFEDFYGIDQENDSEFRDVFSRRILEREFMQIKLDPLNCCSAGPIGGDIFKWQGAIMGPERSPYEGGIFFLSIEIPLDYPIRPPQIKFLTKVYHPNIDAGGNIYIDTLNIDWTPAFCINSLLLSIWYLLANPIVVNNPSNPASSHFRNRADKYKRIAREWTQKYAIG